MFKREAHLVVLRDSAATREALQSALSDANAEEAPGLRRALAILDDTREAEDPRRQWTRQILDEAGLDPKSQSVHAVREVRKALPGLSLSAAVSLVKQVAGE